MKKIKKSIFTVFLTIVMLISSILPAYAEDGIMPIYDHCASCGTGFYIINGVATVSVNYIAYESTFTEAHISIKIQKRFLGIFWTTVDIGYPNNTWEHTSPYVEDYIRRTFDIEDTGVYRAVFEIEFHGTTGVVDTIEDKIVFEYN